MDPRPAGIGRRLDRVRRIVAVSGGKGGIGKSFVASALSLALVDAGGAVGLLDLDLTGPCDHVFLGREEGLPAEEFGVEPPRVHGIRFMSVACFAGSAPAPLRGGDVSNALLELLAITEWGELDLLVIDMPPGLGDATLDAARLLRRAEYLILATPSRVVLGTVRRMLSFHAELGSSLLGLVENMGPDGAGAVRELAAAFDLPVLAEVPFDPEVERATGEPERLRRTAAAVALRPLAARLLGGAGRT